MFNTLWNILTLQWGKVGLPCSNVLELNKYYTAVNFMSDAYEDPKQAEKAFLKLVGGKGFKKVLSKRSIEILTPPQMFPEIIGTYDLFSYKEERIQVLQEIKRMERVHVVVESDWVESILSDDLFFPEGRKALRRVGMGGVRSQSINGAMFGFYSENNKEKLDKHVPEHCPSCGSEVYGIVRWGMCYRCWSAIPEAQKVLKKAMGAKLFKFHLMEDRKGELLAFKEMKKKKYREFLLNYDEDNRGATFFRPAPDKLNRRTLQDLVNDSLDFSDMEDDGDDDNW